MRSYACARASMPRVWKSAAQAPSGGLLTGVSRGALAGEADRRAPGARPRGASAARPRRRAARGRPAAARRMTRAHVFPAILVVLDLAAAIVYWTAAAVLTFVVTW